MPLTQLSASNQFGLPNQTDVFFFDSAGALRVAWAGTGAFHPAIALTAAGTAPQGAAVAASNQFGIADQTDVFFIGSTGALSAAWVDGGQTWHAPLPITAPGIAPPGGAVAACNHAGTADQTDVFYVNNSGAVCWAWVAGSGTWQSPGAITPAGVALPGAPLAASQHFGVPGQTDVFYVDVSGAVCVISAAGTGAWSSPTAISGAGVAPPQAALATSNQFGIANQTDVFYVSNAGNLSVLWADAAGAWNGPTLITGAGVAPPGAGVAISNQFGIDDQTDVFYISNSGAVCVLYVDRAGTWNGPVTIAPAGAAPAGAPVVAANQFGIFNQTDVFYVSNEGALSVLEVDGSGAWGGPTIISPPSIGTELSAWAGEYQTQIGATQGFPAAYFSPLVVHNDGSVDIASTPVAIAFTPYPSPAATFESAPIRGTVASGAVQFGLTGSTPSFSGLITPYPGGAPVAFSGTLQVSLPSPTLSNLVQADALLEAGFQCYVGGSNGAWLVAGDGQALTATAPVPALAQLFTVELVSGGGFRLAVAGSTTQYVAIEGEGAVSPLVLGSTPATFHCYASVSGYAALADTDGRYWTLSGEAAVLQSQTALEPPMLFNLGVVPLLDAGVGQPVPGVADVTVTACDLAVGVLVWHATGGLFLALGLGPYVGSGVVAPGMIAAIKASPAGATALEALVSGVRQNPGQVLALTTVFLGAVYQAGLMWKLLVLALSSVGWYLLFRVFAKILEWILLPEVEAAILLASFAVWSAQAVVAAQQVASACTE